MWHVSVLRADRHPRVSSVSASLYTAVCAASVSHMIHLYSIITTCSNDVMMTAVVSYDYCTTVVRLSDVFPSGVVENRKITR